MLYLLNLECVVTVSVFVVRFAACCAVQVSIWLLTQEEHQLLLSHFQPAQSQQWGPQWSLVSAFECSSEENNPANPPLLTFVCRRRTASLFLPATHPQACKL